eukprot:g483.t1
MKENKSSSKENKTSSSSVRRFAPVDTIGDTVGVLWDRINGHVYYTRNGVLGVTSDTTEEQGLKTKPSTNNGKTKDARVENEAIMMPEPDHKNVFGNAYYPAIGFANQTTRLKVNFGGPTDQPFKWQGLEKWAATLRNCGKKIQTRAEISEDIAEDRLLENSKRLLPNNIPYEKHRLAGRQHRMNRRRAMEYLAHNWNKLFCQYYKKCDMSFVHPCECSKLRRDAQDLLEIFYASSCEDDEDTNPTDDRVSSETNDRVSTETNDGVSTETNDRVRSETVNSEEGRLVSKQAKKLMKHEARVRGTMKLLARYNGDKQRVADLLLGGDEILLSDDSQKKFYDIIDSPINVVCHYTTHLILQLDNTIDFLNHCVSAFAPSPFIYNNNNSSTSTQRRSDQKSTLATQSQQGNPNLTDEITTTSTRSENIFSDLVLAYPPTAHTKLSLPPELLTSPAATTTTSSNESTISEERNTKLREYYYNKMVFIERGQCPFTEKVRHAQEAGASGVLVGDMDKNLEKDWRMGLPEDGTDTASDIRIPVAMIGRLDALRIKAKLKELMHQQIANAEDEDVDEQQQSLDTNEESTASRSTNSGSRTNSGSPRSVRVCFTLGHIPFSTLIQKAIITSKHDDDKNPSSSFSNENLLIAEEIEKEKGEKGKEEEEEEEEEENEISNDNDICGKPGMPSILTEEQVSFWHQHMNEWVVYLRVDLGPAYPPHIRYIDGTLRGRESDTDGKNDGGVSHVCVSLRDGTLWKGPLSQCLVLSKLRTTNVNNKVVVEIGRTTKHNRKSAKDQSSAYPGNDPNHNTQMDSIFQSLIDNAPVDRANATHSKEEETTTAVYQPIVSCTPTTHGKTLYDRLHGDKLDNGNPGAGSSGGSSGADSSGADSSGVDSSGADSSGGFPNPLALTFGDISPYTSVFTADFQSNHDETHHIIRERCDDPEGNATGIALGVDAALMEEWLQAVDQMLRGHRVLPSTRELILQVLQVGGSENIAMARVMLEDIGLRLPSISPNQRRRRQRNGRNNDSGANRDNNRNRRNNSNSSRHNSNAQRNDSTRRGANREGGEEEDNLMSPSELYLLRNPSIQLSQNLIEPILIGDGSISSLIDLHHRRLRATLSVNDIFHYNEILESTKGRRANKKDDRNKKTRMSSDASNKTQRSVPMSHSDKLPQLGEVTNDPSLSSTTSISPMPMTTRRGLMPLAQALVHARYRNDQWNSTLTTTSPSSYGAAADPMRGSSSYNRGNNNSGTPHTNANVSINNTNTNANTLSRDMNNRLDNRPAEFDIPRNRLRYLLTTSGFQERLHNDILNLIWGGSNGPSLGRRVPGILPMFDIHNQYHPFSGYHQNLMRSYNDTLEKNENLLWVRTGDGSARMTNEGWGDAGLLNFANLQNSLWQSWTHPNDVSEMERRRRTQSREQGGEDGDNRRVNRNNNVRAPNTTRTAAGTRTSTTSGRARRNENATSENNFMPSSSSSSSFPDILPPSYDNRYNVPVTGGNNNGFSEIPPPVPTTVTFSNNNTPPIVPLFPSVQNFLSSVSTLSGTASSGFLPSSSGGTLLHEYGGMYDQHMNSFVTAGTTTTTMNSSSVLSRGGQHQQQPMIILNTNPNILGTTTESSNIMGGSSSNLMGGSSSNLMGVSNGTFMGASNSMMFSPTDSGPSPTSASSFYHPFMRPLQKLSSHPIFHWREQRPGLKTTNGQNNSSSNAITRSSMNSNLSTTSNSTHIWTNAVLEQDIVNDDGENTKDKLTNGNRPSPPPPPPPGISYPHEMSPGMRVKVALQSHSIQQIIIAIERFILLGTMRDFAMINDESQHHKEQNKTTQMNQNKKKKRRVASSPSFANRYRMFTMTETTTDINKFVKELVLLQDKVGVLCEKIYLNDILMMQEEEKSSYPHLTPGLDAGSSGFDTNECLAVVAFEDLEMTEETRWILPLNVLQRFERDEISIIPEEECNVDLRLKTQCQLEGQLQAYYANSIIDELHETLCDLQDNVFREEDDNSKMTLAPLPKTCDIDSSDTALDIASVKRDTALRLYRSNRLAPRSLLEIFQRSISNDNNNNQTLIPHLNKIKLNLDCNPFAEYRYSNVVPLTPLPELRQNHFADSLYSTNSAPGCFSLKRSLVESCALVELANRSRNSKYIIKQAHAMANNNMKQQHPRERLSGKNEQRNYGAKDNGYDKKKTALVVTDPSYNLSSFGKRKLYSDYEKVFYCHFNNSLTDSGRQQKTPEVIGGLWIDFAISSMLPLEGLSLCIYRDQQCSNLIRRISFATIGLVDEKQKQRMLNSNASSARRMGSSLSSSRFSSSSSGLPSRFAMAGLTEFTTGSSQFFSANRNTGSEGSGSRSSADANGTTSSSDLQEIMSEIFGPNVNAKPEEGRDKGNEEANNHDIPIDSLGGGDITTRKKTFRELCFTLRSMELNGVAEVFIRLEQEGSKTGDAQHSPSGGNTVPGGSPGPGSSLTQVHSDNVDGSNNQNENGARSTGGGAGAVTNAVSITSLMSSVTPDMLRSVRSSHWTARMTDKQVGDGPKQNDDGRESSRSHGDDELITTTQDNDSETPSTCQETFDGVALLYGVQNFEQPLSFPKAILPLHGGLNVESLHPRRLPDRKSPPESTDGVTKDVLQKKKKKIALLSLPSSNYTVGITLTAIPKEFSTTLTLLEALANANVGPETIVERNILTTAFQFLNITNNNNLPALGQLQLVTALLQVLERNPTCFYESISSKKKG